MSSFDFMNVCRLCLAKDHTTLQPIFEGEGEVRQISLKITSCLPVKVNREDKLPQKICDECLYKVELLYEFWNNTIQAEKQLLQWLSHVDTQGYAVTTILNQDIMKGEQSNENRLDGSVMQQVSGHQSSMNMGIDNMMSMIMPNSNQQQITSVPMGTSSGSVQNAQVIAGSSTQTTHDQILQSQTNAPTQHEEEETSEDEENSDDECDGDDGLSNSVKEEEEDLNKNMPTAYVDVSLQCDEAGPSGIRQQKLDIQEMAQAADVDPKTGLLNGNGYFLYGKESIPMLPWQIVTLEGNPYYAFLPANEVPKTEKKSQLNSKQFDSDVLDVDADNTEEPIVVTSDNVCTDMTYTDSLGNFYTVKIKDEITASKDELFVVDENELNNDVYNCDDCNTCFPVLQMLKQHRQTVHMEKMSRFKCKLCPKICRSSIAFRMHMNLEHGKKQNADEQNTDEQDTYEQNIDEQNTINVEEQSEVYRCDVCNYETINKSTFKSHINRKHSLLLRSSKQKDVVELEEYTCDGCSFKCQSKRRLKEHLERKHFSEYKYNCEYCNKKFKVKSDMRLHVRFKHIEDPLVCDVCGKTCSNSNSLYVHQKWAHFKPKYECKICKRRMVTQQNLDQHILLQHKRKESFVCEECGKSFSENHRLKQHMMTHTGDRPFDCHICGRAFSRRTGYRQHLLLHTGKRPYVCDICGKAFTQKPGLICHRKSHPGVHPPLPVVYIDHILNDFMKKK